MKNNMLIVVAVVCNKDGLYIHGCVAKLFCLNMLVDFVHQHFCLLDVRPK